MIVHARAKEGDQITAHIFIGLCQSCEFSHGFHFGQGGGQVKLGEAMFGGNSIKQIIKRLDADGLKHVIAFVGGNWNVGHKKLQLLLSLQLSANWPTEG